MISGCVLSKTTANDTWHYGDWCANFGAGTDSSCRQLHMSIAESEPRISMVSPEGNLQPLAFNSIVKTRSHFAVFISQIRGVLTVSRSDKSDTTHYSAAWRQNGKRSEADRLTRNSIVLELKKHQADDLTNKFPFLHDANSYSPRVVTLLPTYRCNAACEQCCFESNPNIRHRLSLETMIARLDQAIDVFPDISLLVVSGGECFLLGDDLMSVLKHASSRGLDTRCVSNGFWGRTKKTAKRTVRKLIDSGIKEMNFSTGKDHQRWVRADHVVVAATEVAKAGISTLITIEADGDGENLVREFHARSDVKELLQHRHVQVQSNTWMPFREDGSGRGSPPSEGGCDQLFRNYVITPHDMLSACCGLTLEHIPEMKLGKLSDEVNVRDMYLSQLEDFLKIWIHIDGPTEIMRKLFGKEVVDDELRNVNHICQSCAILHKHPGVRKALEENYLNFVPEVLAKFNLKKTLDKTIEERVNIY